MPPIAEGFRGQGGLSCKNCQRKKIKCDLNTPCAACQKSGAGDSCTRDQVPEAYQKLLDRIQTLENLLEGRNTSTDAGQVSAATPEVQLGTQAISSDILGNQILPSPDEQDAAQILEFLAWGRRKDQIFHDAPENESGPRRHSVAEPDEVPKSYLSNTHQILQLELLEILLPSQENVSQLVEFHGRCLVWYHGSYNSIT